MHYACFMRGQQCGGCVDRHLESVIDRQWSIRHSLAQRFAIDKLHGDVMQMVLLTDVVDGDDIGMVEC